MYIMIKSISHPIILFRTQLPDSHIKENNYIVKLDPLLKPTLIL